MAKRTKRKNKTKKSKKAVPDWREFEIAVARFVAAIGNSAKVTHDAEIPDAQTGGPRQRDVWVEWSIGGHFPAKALISCKYWSQPLDQLDIDHFNGEFLSSKAQMGIIYSRKGYNANAIEKAKVLGFHCCQLYRNEPAELPESLAAQIYWFVPTFQIMAKGEEEECKFDLWKEVLSLTIDDSTALGVLKSEFDQYQRVTNTNDSWRKASESHPTALTIQRANLRPLETAFRSYYDIYRAKIEYTLVNGSYNVTEGSFIGNQSSPQLNYRDAHPGPGWDKVDSIPETMPKKCIVIFAGVNSEKLFADLGESEWTQHFS